MRDMQASLEKLRTDAAEAALIRDLATDSNKRELFARLATHLTTLATEVERAIAVRLAKAVRQLRGGILVRPIADRARLSPSAPQPHAYGPSHGSGCASRTAAAVVAAGRKSLSGPQQNGPEQGDLCRGRPASKAGLPALG
jgi:hypothetical protein